MDTSNALDSSVSENHRCDLPGSGFPSVKYCSKAQADHADHESQSGSEVSSCGQIIRSNGEQKIASIIAALRYSRATDQKDAVLMIMSRIREAER